MAENGGINPQARIFGGKSMPKIRTAQIPKFNPLQEDILENQLLNARFALPGAHDLLQNILSQQPEAFEAFEAPAKRQFSEETIPGIANAFGGLDALRSSGFGQQVAGAGERLSEGLAQQRANLSLPAIQSVLSLLSPGLQERNTNVIQPYNKGPSAWQETGNETLKLLAQALPFILAAL